MNLYYSIYYICSRCCVKCVNCDDTIMVPDHPIEYLEYITELTPSKVKEIFGIQEKEIFYKTWNRILPPCCKKPDRQWEFYTWTTNDVNKYEKYIISKAVANFL